MEISPASSSIREAPNATLCLNPRPSMAFHSTPRLVLCVADVFQQTIRALRRSRKAQLASMPDDLMRKQGPSLAGDYFHQVLFDAFGLVVLRQLQPPRNAVDVGVNYDSFVLLEPRAQYDIRGFACDSGNLEQIVHVFRNAAAEIVHDHLRRADD